MILGSEIFRTVRGLMRSPGFLVLTVVVLALGIGANTVIFSIVNAVLLRPYPYEDPDRLVQVDGTDTSRNEIELRASIPDYVDIRQQMPAVSGLAAVEQVSFSLSLDRQPVRVQGARASADLFKVLGVKAALGRLFLPGEDRPGAEKTLILSNGLWVRVFGADPKMVGRQVRLDGEPRTIVGVLDPNAEYPDTAEAWVPLEIAPAQTTRDQRSLVLLGRLAPGVSVEKADLQAAVVAHRLALSYPTTNQRYGLRVVSLLESRVGRYRQLIGILVAVVSFVLLLACANVANLLLQRAVLREREMVLRIVLGAGRLRLLRLMLIETTILALLGALLGLAVARWLNGVIVASIPFALPPYVKFDLSPPVLAFALATALLVAFFLGLLPAARYIRKAGARILTQEGVRSGTSAERKALRNVLVVTQVALAFILLLGAALMVRSFQRLQAVSPGFDPQGRLLVDLPLPEEKYSTSERRADFYEQVVQRVGSLSGVRAAAAVSHAPLRGSLLTGFEQEGKTHGPNDRMVLAGVRLVQWQYLTTMGLPIQDGRDLAVSDTAATPRVAVISRHMAIASWPGQSAIGKRFHLESGDPATWWTVVGITRETLFALNRPPGNDIYIPFRQWSDVPLQLVVDVNGDPLAMVGAVRRRPRARSRPRHGPDRVAQGPGGRDDLVSAPVRPVALDLRPVRPGAGRGRDLRLDVVLRVAAQPPARRPHGARSAGPRDAPSGGARRRPGDRDRYRHRPVRRGDPDRSSAQSSLSGQSLRPRQLPRCGGAPPRRRRRGLLSAGSAGGDADRSTDQLCATNRLGRSRLMGDSFKKHPPIGVCDRPCSSSWDRRGRARRWCG